jgi:hypothetical protein
MVEVVLLSPQGARIALLPYPLPPVWRVPIKTRMSFKWITEAPVYKPISTQDFVRIGQHTYEART